ncbi:MBL fold metallo-hydrolase [Eikenella sp. S3360]|uniref:MBL fold metallo-hydrolase n=1 Tax=Eikenella glucosivorans TaxID=2766967 RepID=A0ABS0N8N7_9NEIS|nr:MBL fold metallo-hydrolase [Eikenella glucosivorans]MBH5328688.1 MBL fold metallo-hydrolase [Eikenella glucosivorans]
MALQLNLFPVTPFRQNCSLLWDEQSKEAVWIDVGGEAEWLQSEAAKLGLQPKEIWLTHGHLDHAAGVADMIARTPLPVIGPHRADQWLLDSLPAVTAGYGFPVSPPVQPTRWLEEGDELAVGGYRFQVLHAPGHTPGHVVFYCPEANLLIAGDVLFYESIGRTDFERSSHADLLHSIREKLLVLPEDTIVVPGHGRTTTIGHEKRHNPFLAG